MLLYSTQDIQEHVLFSSQFIPAADKRLTTSNKYIYMTVQRSLSVKWRLDYMPGAQSLIGLKGPRDGAVGHAI